MSMTSPRAGLKRSGNPCVRAAVNHSGVCLGMERLALTLTKAAGICKPAFGGKWPEEKLQLDEDSTRHPTIVDSLYPEP